MNFDIPHHDGSSLYVSVQEPTAGSTVRLRLRVPAGYGQPQKVFLRSIHDGEPRYDECHPLRSTEGTAAAGPEAWTWWEASVEATNTELKYRFLLQAPGIGTPRWQWLNADGLFDHDTPDHHDFRLICHAPAPHWLAHSVMYQVFPDRFARSTAADGRPVPGWAIPCSWDDPVEPTGPNTPRQFFGGDLDGITEKLDHIQRLGVTVLYLTPFFPGQSNHRYDADTFTSVDPVLGGDEALVRLTTAAHARGLKVIGDLTLNHSGSSHEWFKEAVDDPQSTEAAFYYFSPDHRKYACWLGTPSLPKFNWESAELRRRFITGDTSVLQRWLKPPFNLDGWRIDVANMTGRHGTVDVNHDIARLVLETMRDGAMTYSNFTRPLWQWLTSGDVNVNFFGTPLPSPPRATARQFVQTHRAFTAALPWRVRTQNMNALNTHDTARAATVLIPGGQAIGLGLMFTLPGLPTIFAGDEFGLYGTNGEDARTPMPWAYPERIREDQTEDIAQLARLRHELPALRTGSLRWLHAGDDVLAYVREDTDNSVLVVASRAAFDGLSIPAALLHPEGSAARFLPLWETGTTTAAWRGASLKLSGSGPAVKLWRLPGIRVPEADPSGLHTFVPAPDTAPAPST